MRDQIDDGESMADNAFQLFFDPLFDDFRKVVAVNAFCFLIAHAADFVICAFDLRCVKIVFDRLDFFDSLADQTGVLDDDFFRFFLTQMKRPQAFHPSNGNERSAVRAC